MRILLCLLALALAAPEMIPEESLDIVGHEVPPITLELRGGGSFDLAGHKGKTVLISFWASWCTPCQKELPALAKLAEERTDLVYLAINVDREKAPAEKFLSRIDIGTLPVAFDPDALTMGQFGVMSMPTMFAIGPDGKVKYRKVGFSEERGFTEILGAIK